nr:MAG TPA: hypothetical protein [Caudoviricetes sp.]
MQQHDAFTFLEEYEKNYSSTNKGSENKCY